VEAVKTLSAHELLIICSGTFEEAAYEDVLGAGALCDAVWAEFDNGNAADSALMARHLWQTEKENLLRAISKSRNGQRLLSSQQLSGDVQFCARQNVFGIAAGLGKDGWLRQLS
jgi:phosphosulfolactate phosphohydrolase-like enzyme